MNSIKSILIVLVSMSFNSQAFAMDISYPLVRCDKGKTTVIVGRKVGNLSRLWIGLYQWEKIQHPSGSGVVDFPQPVIGTSLVTQEEPSINGSVNYISRERIRLNLEAKYADEDIDFQDPLSYSAKVIYMLNGKKTSIENMKCQVFNTEV